MNEYDREQTNCASRIAIHLHTLKANLIRRRHAFTSAMQKVFQILQGSTTKEMLVFKYAPTGIKTTNNVIVSACHCALLGYTHFPTLTV